MISSFNIPKTATLPADSASTTDAPSPLTREQMLSFICSVTQSPEAGAQSILAALTEQKALILTANLPDTDRTVFIKEDFHHAEAASYKPQNIIFHFRNASLASGTEAIEFYLSTTSDLNGREQLLFILLSLLKLLAGLKVELAENDARLLGFLWKERLHRRLEAENEYKAFGKYMEFCGKTMITEPEYHASLNRLAALDVIRLEDGLILLREKIVMR